MVAVLDALGLAEDWERAGVPPQQARQMAAALRDRVVENLVTKDDLRVAIAELRTEMAALRAEFHSELGKMQARLVMWFAGMMILQVGAIAALVKLLE